ncbi:hypothetical protein BDN72DRAFT_849307 [Pluteus cervinus]|uniref:Uncharacterized protein n=1 Tax=Pluteus cervinus TaxID=181527 RepID=A0ACD3A8K4_9AGAR|nr:hypothetical protein BDN72DRAFT_849307 [Pluteus cervinus]
MFKALASAVLVASLMAQSAFAADCSRSYTVQDGDICDGISAAQNVSTYQLAVVNNGVIDNSCSNLSSNTTICLGWTGEDCSTTYTVEEDDTCEGIQTAYGVNSTILYLNNPQINEECDNIYIGEVRVWFIFSSV